jgi:hypothetical protein
MVVELENGGLGEPVPVEAPVGKRPFVPLNGMTVTEIGISSVVNWLTLERAGQFETEAAQLVTV